MTEEQIKEYINKRIQKVTPKVVYHKETNTTFVYIRYRNEKGEYQTPMVSICGDITESNLDVLIENYESR